MISKFYLKIKFIVTGNSPAQLSNQSEARPLNEFGTRPVFVTCNGRTVLMTI